MFSYLILTLVIELTTCETKSKHFTLSDVCAERSCQDSNPLFQKTASSRIECAVECVKSGNCKSFFHDHTTGTCSGYNQRYPSSAGSGTDAGMVYHEPIVGSCADVYKADITASNGVYNIYNDTQEPFQVYCDFQDGHGYTYVSPNMSVDFNIDDLYTNTSHVVLRDIRTDGTQYESRIEQLEAFKHIPISIQFNSHVNYTSVSNSDMSPYIFIGLIPEAATQLGQTEGFTVNGIVNSFVNCDGNGNSFFAFLFNHNNVSSGSSGSGQRIARWYTDSILMDSDKNMPSWFYSFFESHFGGCGYYITANTAQDIEGAAVGLRYDITCPVPVDIANTKKIVSGVTPGSTVIYTCNTGYVLLSGNSTRICGQTGRWTGKAPYCVQS